MQYNGGKKPKFHCQMFYQKYCIMSGILSQSICCYVVYRVTRENGNNGLFGKIV